MIKHSVGYYTQLCTKQLNTSYYIYDLHPRSKEFAIATIHIVCMHKLLHSQYVGLSYCGTLKYMYCT